MVEKRNADSLSAWLRTKKIKAIVSMTELPGEGGWLTVALDAYTKANRQEIPDQWQGVEVRVRPAKSRPVRV